jgi:hypothetical protein
MIWFYKNRIAILSSFHKKKSKIRLNSCDVSGIFIERFSNIKPFVCQPNSFIGWFVKLYFQAVLSL